MYYHSRLCQRISEKLFSYFSPPNHIKAIFPTHLDFLAFALSVGM